MSYLVFARKFRPQTFQALVGQEHITRALANAIVRDRVPHALLFTGPRGVGKTTMARVFARALNCNNSPHSVSEGGGSKGGVSERNGAGVGHPAGISEEESRKSVEPCGECSNCQEIARSGSIAVWEIDGASNNSVENVRELIESLRSLPPPRSRYKIYIIDEVHMLSTAAFNALLKSLEEPPPNTIFIFATTEPQKIPETVISRCQRHDFRRLATQIISKQLREIAQAEQVLVDEEVFEFISRRAQGGMRDAESMLDRLFVFSEERISLPLAQQVFGVMDSSFFYKLSEAVVTQDPANCFLLLDEAFCQSLDIRSFITDFLTHFRSLLLVSISCERSHQAPAAGSSSDIKKILGLGKEELDILTSRARALSSYDVERLFEIARETADQAILSPFPRFVLEAGIAKMASLPLLRPLGQIITQLESYFETSPKRGNAPPVSIQVSPQESEHIQAKSFPKPLPSSQISEGNALQSSDLLSGKTDSDLYISHEIPGSPLPSIAKISNEGTYSWAEFVNYIKAQKSELVLAELLRRASPRLFVTGRLELEVNSFDCKLLKDPARIEKLNDNLERYSGVAHWNLKIEEHKGVGNTTNQSLGETKYSTEAAAQSASSAVQKENKPPVCPPPDSLAALEADLEEARVLQIEDEARNHPMIQKALSTFSGSRVEKILVLKPT